MPSPTAETVDFASNRGSDSGYLATPGSGGGPGLVQEWWGRGPHITDVCDRFAAEGFVAPAPDPCRGRTVAGPDAAHKTMMGLRPDRAGRDTSGAVDEDSRPGRHSPETSALAWERTLAFLRATPE